MHRTNFAGLTAPDPGDPPQVDGGTFFTTNPDVIDRFLSIGAVTHRHDAHARLSNPVLQPSASIVPSGGTIGPSQDFNIGYTLIDADQGETMLSDAATVTTPGPEPPPQESLIGSADYTAGFLVAADYSYAITHQTAAGIETALGPVLNVNRDPGFASGQIHLGGLSAELDPDHAVEWRLWRSINAGPWRLLAEGTDDLYLDDGSVIPDADNTQQPPSEFSNSIQGAYQISVTLPAAGSGAQQEPAIGSASFIALYVSQGGFADPCLYGIYPVASAGATILIPSFVVVQGAPPEVNRSIPGAHKIDPDFELIDWHWKRPVSTSAVLPVPSELGDVRMALDTWDPYIYIASGAGSAWTHWAGAAGPPGADGTNGTDGADGAPGADGADGTTPISVAGSAVIPSIFEIEFVGSGEIGVDVIDLGGGSARVLVSAAVDTGGGGGGVEILHNGNDAEETVTNDAFTAMPSTDAVSFTLADDSFVRIYASGGTRQPGAGGTRVGLFIDGVQATNENGDLIQISTTSTAERAFFLSPPGYDGAAMRATQFGIMPTSVGAGPRLGNGGEFALILPAGAHTIELRYQPTSSGATSYAAHRSLVAEIDGPVT